MYSNKIVSSDQFVADLYNQQIQQSLLNITA